jgi:hypothetical protein
MKCEKEHIELYGCILGDGNLTFRKIKYPQMTFYNYDIKLMRYVQRTIKKLSPVKTEIRFRNRDGKYEYSLNVPVEIVRKLLDLDFNKKNVPKWILDSRYGINFLKVLFECEGHYNNGQIIISQNNRPLLEQCVTIANRYGISAHVHGCNENEYYLALENTKKLNKLFGRTIKYMKVKNHGKGNYYFTKRKILEFLNDIEWRTTVDIRDKLQKQNIKTTKRNLIQNHLIPLLELGIMESEEHPIYKCGYKWKLKCKLSRNDILNFPYSLGIEKNNIGRRR